MSDKAKQLIEQLRLEVVCPAKAKVLRGQEAKLVSSNYRFLGSDERSIWDWRGLCEKIGIDLEIELSKLVEEEIGPEFEVKPGNFSGYLGVASDSWLEVVEK